MCKVCIDQKTRYYNEFNQNLVFVFLFLTRIGIEGMSLDDTGFTPWTSEATLKKSRTDFFFMPGRLFPEIKRQNLEVSPSTFKCVCALQSLRAEKVELI